jgi:sugar/nucleoside kinase (ribokinase family)
MRIGVLGMATRDTILSVTASRYEHDSVTAVNRTTECPGGKGLLAAIAVSRAGGSPVPMAFVGRHSPLPEQLSRTMPTNRLIRELDDDHRVWILASDAHRIVTFAQWQPTPISPARARRLAADFVRSVDLVYITMEHPALVEAVLDQARRRSVPVVSNLCAPLLEHCRHLVDEIVRSSHTVICNESETESSLSIVHGNVWPTSGASLLETVISTRGAAGGRWSTHPFRHWTAYAPVPAEAECVVGAGDTFNGQYLVSRYVEGQGVARACADGARRSAEAVAHFGSGLPA